MWFAHIFGGTYDSGNGYGWTPDIVSHVKRYYREDWHKFYTLTEWIFPSRRRARMAAKHD